MSDPALALFLILSTVVVATMLLSIATARQVALLTRRFPFREVVSEQGPELSAVAPPVTGRNILGDPVHLAPPHDGPTAFVFLAEDCKVCTERLPDLAQLASEADAFGLWLIAEEDPSNEFQQAHPALTSRLVVSPDAFVEWNVRLVPYALVVSPTGEIQAKGDLLNMSRLRVELGLDPEAEDQLDRSLIEQTSLATAGGE